VTLKNPETALSLEKVSNTEFGFANYFFEQFRKLKFSKSLKIKMLAISNNYNPLKIEYQHLAIMI
jgi:hypothetical protein